MTLEEAKKIAAIVGTIDSGCRACAKDFCSQLNACGFGFVFEIADNFYSVPDEQRVTVRAI